MDLSIAVGVICALGVLVILGIGAVIYIFVNARKLKKTKQDADSLISEAKEEAQSIRKEAADRAKEASDLAISQAKVSASNIESKATNEADRIKLEARNEADKIQHNAEVKAERIVAERTEEAERLTKSLKEQKLEVEKRQAELDSLIDQNRSRSSALDAREDELKRRSEETEQLHEQAEQELHRRANLSAEDARREVMNRAEERSAKEVAELLKRKRDEAEDNAEKIATTIMANAMERYSQDVATERTTATVSLPSDDMKGRIIGREGRNIKTLESILGVDILIDDTPEILTVSCFNPIRREIAVRTIQALIKDGRIQPGKIEETYAKIEASMEDEIKRTGEEVVMKLGLPRINRELYKYIGRLKYRTSYTQNGLVHSIQVGELAGAMAGELGLDQTLAKRCGLLHDIGKSADFEMEGSHVEIGVRLARKYGEPEEVISAIASHHGDNDKRFIYDELVVAADTLSAARPGARSETLENYIQRVEGIERICRSYDGVQNCYALQSGRDVRVMVQPEKMSDSDIVLLAQTIRDRIENEMTYPGNIKVTVIRESRAVEIAK